MESKLLHIEFQITTGLLRDSKFRTIKSPYKFTPEVIYFAEYALIMSQLKAYNAHPLNVVNYAYICGLMQPYGMRGMTISAAEDGYTVHIVVMINAVQSERQVYDEIRNQFIGANTLENRKKLYRRLMLEHHPDKGGNEDIAKFINSFKNW